MPAAVILAGVLLVVGVAAAVNWSMRSDPPPPAPSALPPALGAVPLAPADDWQLPPPSAAPSRSPSPSAPTSPGASVTRSPSRPPTTPSSSPPRTPPPPVTIARAEVRGTVDLSAEGTRDWVHWGAEDTFSMERREAGGFAILEGTPDAPRFRHALSPERFRWRDGAPMTSSSGTPTGIRTCGKGNGFTVSAPAGTGARTLRLYLGVFAAQGRLTARLSTGGETVSATLDSPDSRLDTAVFTVTYRAPEAGTLLLSWDTARAYDDDCAGVALQAATLR